MFIVYFSEEFVFKLQTPTEMDPEDKPIGPCPLLLLYFFSIKSACNTNR